MRENRKIVLPENADAALRFAAEELKNFIRKCTGVYSEIVSASSHGLFIGGEPSENVRSACNDAFEVVFENGNVYFRSNSSRGVIYAVYDFTERFFGVRFLTSDYTYIPKYRGLRAKAESYTSIPDFPLRTFLTKETEDGLFSVRKRFYNECFPVSEKYGGDFGWRCGNHALLHLVPKSVYLTDENKERNAHMYQFDRNGEAIDICISDGITADGEADCERKESAFNAVLESLKKIVEEDRDCKYISIGQMDHAEPCRCERCLRAEKRYKRSGMNVIFGNLLLKKLREWMKENGIAREIHLVIFAYNYSTFAPVEYRNGKITPLVKADKNLHVRIAPIGANCYYPIDSDMHFMPYKRIIEEWRSVCDNIMLWTYHTNYKCYFWFFPTMRHWSRDLMYFKQIGAEYLFMQSDHTERMDWKAEMETYVAAKVLWNCESDPYELRSEFIRLYYGEAAEYVEEILRIFEKNYESIAKRSEKMRRETYRSLFDKDIEIPTDVSAEETAAKLRKEAEAEWMKNVYFSVYHTEIMRAREQPKELLEEQMRFIRQAKAAVENTEDGERILAALEKIEISLRCMIAYNYGTYYGEDGKDTYLAGFFRLCKKHGVKYIGEGVSLKQLQEKFDFRDD